MECENFIINTTGGIGIGTTSPASLLHVNGSASKPGGGPWTTPSNIRLKQHVRPLAGALDKLLWLRGICFEWKEPEKQGNLTGPQMGMLAHEVEEVFPEWISTDPEGYKQLTVRSFEALVVEALRTLKAAQDEIKGRNQALETKLGQLEAKSQAALFVHNEHTLEPRDERPSGTMFTATQGGISGWAIDAGRTGTKTGEPGTNHIAY